MALRVLLRRYWPAVTIAVTVAAIVIAAIVILRTLPPRTIVMATGPEGGAYYEVGKRYQAALASAGVKVRLVSTAGSLENVALMLDPKSGVSVGLIESGTTGKEATTNLESLGTVFYEPLWLFHRRLPRMSMLERLQGGRISVGLKGSGTRALSLALLKRAGFGSQAGELLALAPQAARDGLLAGQIDTAVMLESWDSPVVRQLIADERVELSSFPRADAFIALYPFLNKLVMPRSVGDLEKDLPRADVTLLAPKASLVVRKDLHPAIQALLLDAAVEIHSPPGIFQRAGQFPAAEAIDIPLSSEALQFYKTGRPFLYNYVPFWMATLVKKLIVILIPILGLLYPMIRFLPSSYDWLMRKKIIRIYGELKLLENEIIEARQNGRDTVGLIERLDSLERQANNLRIPLAYMSMLYMLRNHIDLVRAQVQKQPATS